MDDQNPFPPSYRSMMWRQGIVNWTLRILAVTQLLWLVVALLSTRWILGSWAGWIFLGTFAWVLACVFRPRLRLRWRLGAVFAFLLLNFSTGLIYAGPTPGNTSLVFLAMVFATLFFGVRFGTLLLIVCLGEMGVCGWAWYYGVLPPGGLAPAVDPRSLASWARSALAVANGSVAIGLVVAIAIRQLAHAATEAAAALDREKESESRYTDLFLRLPLGVYRTAADGRILAANPALVRMLGFERVDDLVGRNLESKEYFPGYDRADFKARLEREGEIRGAEAEWRRRDGSVIFVREYARAIRDGDGRIACYEGTVEDFTERKALEERLRHAQRLEAIGTLASGVAHDLNNILTPVLMASELMEESASPGDQDLATLIKNGARRGTEIIRKLLAFGRTPSGSEAAVDPIHLLREVASITRATFPRNIEIVESYPRQAPFAGADVNQLHQVIMNLCVNARDAMPEGGRLTLSLSTVHRPPEAGGPSGRFVVLGVEDTGHGIPPEIRGRIFDPFFTTKDVGRGTGLGLWSAYSIVKSHGGFITVESPPGRGTTFKVFLPCTASADADAKAAAPKAIARGAGRMILVVDDEPAILSATRKVLEREGFSVMTAAGGEEAERLAQANREQLRLVISDLMMPGMDGAALVGRLRGMNPALKFIGVSGLDPTGRSEALTAGGFSEMLAKPYDLATLTAAVHRVLG